MHELEIRIFLLFGITVSTGDRNFEERKTYYMVFYRIQFWGGGGGKIHILGN